MTQPGACRALVCKRIVNEPKLQYEDEAGMVEVPIKQSSARDVQYLIWEQTFPCNAARRKLILDRFATWAGNRQITYTILGGRWGTKPWISKLRKA